MVVVGSPLSMEMKNVTHHAEKSTSSTTGGGLDWSRGGGTRRSKALPSTALSSTAVSSSLRLCLASSAWAFHFLSAPE